MAHARPATPAELQDLEDRPVDLNDPQVPPGIRQAVRPMLQPGDALWRCPRTCHTGFLGFGRSYIAIEWWLINADGELVEAFWEEE